MRIARFLLVALTLSLAACASDITGPGNSSLQPGQATMDDGVVVLGSGT